MMLTIDQIRVALTLGNVNLSRASDGTIDAVKVAPMDLDTGLVAEFQDCPLGLFIAAVFDERGVLDRPWPGRWHAVYDHDAWRSPED
jgi:hypothetical protein